MRTSERLNIVNRYLLNLMDNPREQTFLIEEIPQLSVLEPSFSRKSDTYVELENNLIRMVVDNGNDELNSLTLDKFQFVTLLKCANRYLENRHFDKVIKYIRNRFLICLGVYLIFIIF